MNLKYVVPGLPLALRLLLFYIVEALGMFVQLYAEKFLPGSLIMIAGLVLVFARSYSNKPEDTGLENWFPVSFDEFERIETNLKAIKVVKYPRLYRIRFGCLIDVLLVVVAMVSSFLFQEVLIFLVFMDIIIVTFPLFYSGVVKLWTPMELSLKMAGFRAIADKAKEAEGDLVITPYIRFDKDKEGKLIPEDVRFMVELKRTPPDLLGAQFQTAINKGPKGQVPYMYAVFICKGKGPSFLKLGALRFGRFISEPAEADDYSTLVVRQKTESGGYHTADGDCLELFSTVAEALRSVKGTGSPPKPGATP